MSRVDALPRRRKRCCSAALQKVHVKIVRLLDYVVFDVFVRKFRNCNLVQYERHGIMLAFFRIVTLMHSSCVVERRRVYGIFHSNLQLKLNALEFFLLFLTV